MRQVNEFFEAEEEKKLTTIVSKNCVWVMMILLLAKSSLFKSGESMHSEIKRIFVRLILVLVIF